MRHRPGRSWPRDRRWGRQWLSARSRVPLLYPRPRRAPRPLISRLAWRILSIPHRNSAGRKIPRRHCYRVGLINPTAAIQNRSVTPASNKPSGQQQPRRLPNGQHVKIHRLETAFGSTPIGGLGKGQCRQGICCCLVSFGLFALRGCRWVPDPSRGTHRREGWFSTRLSTDVVSMEPCPRARAPDY
jgi:hypothetical protein